MATIAIVDLAHCGTTMTAGILERLGVPMIWRRGKPDKLEDLDVIGALPDEAQFARLVEERERHTWGFKWPGAWKYAGTLQKYLPGATYLAIYKDPVSVTLRRFRTISGEKLAKTARWMRENIEGIGASGLRVEWLSYHRAVAQPCRFAERLARLAGVSVTGSQMDAILEWIR